VIDQIVSIIITSFVGCLGLIIVAIICGLVFGRSDRGPALQRGPAYEPSPAPFIPYGWQAIVPHAGEAFFPRAPHSDPVYEIEIVGVCGHHRGPTDIKPADAFYRADGLRFTDEHYELLLNNRALYNYRYEHQTGPKIQVIESDRGAHRYRFQFDGDNVTLAFGSPRNSWFDTSLGYLLAHVSVLPAGTPTIRQQQERRKQEREEMERRAEREREARAEARRFAQIVQTLSIRAEMNRNWRDPEYREKFARGHSAELIRNQADIRREAEQLLQQPKLLAYLQRHAPTIVPTLLGRLECLLLAEKIAVEKTLSAKDTAQPRAKSIEERPKRKRTSKEVTDLKVRHQQIHLGDKVALAMDKIETIEKVKARVREQYGHLDDDEQQRIIQEILDQVGAEENQNAKTL
jgi:hypothetical protein